MNDKVDHQVIYENIRQATSAKAKADFLADLIFKVVMNDINHLEDKVDKIATKVAWIAGGFFVFTVVANVLIRVL